MYIGWHRTRKTTPNLKSEIKIKYAFGKYANAVVKANSSFLTSRSNTIIFYVGVLHFFCNTCLGFIIHRFCVHSDSMTFPIKQNEALSIYEYNILGLIHIYIYLCENCYHNIYQQLKIQTCLFV